MNEVNGGHFSLKIGLNLDGWEPNHIEYLYYYRAFCTIISKKWGIVSKKIPKIGHPQARKFSDGRLIKQSRSGDSPIHIKTRPL